MKTRHRWLKAAIELTRTDKLEMPWAMANNRREWSVRCGTRAKSQT